MRMIMRSTRGVVTLLVVVVAVVATRCVDALEIRVRAGETECITERVREASTTVSGSWFITRAGNTASPSERGTPPGYGDYYDEYHYWERHSDAFDARGSLESGTRGTRRRRFTTRWGRRSTDSSLRREMRGNCACVSRIRVTETRA